ncbi:hypothetical protein [Microbacterium sp. No. 7]|uniref:hypothetical protein n=1 Tax=Microbacterium sp. No. 7 TaxID=1714373 RepID=UPI0006D1DB3D|nr:hypothetical protein [Microbacterium sp. No. 7]
MSVHGYALWTVGEQLLADLIDILNLANWQRGGDKHAPRPRRLTRPWETRDGVQVLGSDPIPISEFDDWWNAQALK